MQTISPEYAELNRALHETASDYGVGSFRHAATVLELRDSTESETVLDYGCGKGLLKNALGYPDWMFEYDPAVPGKDTKPPRCDLVVCTDVLEHIEPEFLDNTLTHIADLAKRAVFLIIATKASKKWLADGRNTHLIQENRAWWREKLEKLFLISSWEDCPGGEIQMLGSTWRGMGEIVAKSAVSDTIRFEQAKRNCPLVPGRVETAPRHDGRICIAAYGPSLLKTYPLIARERAMFGAKVVTVSGSHDFLIEKGIIPDYHVECDPREHKAKFTQNPHPDVTYWPASCSHPTLIDNLLAHGSKVALWNVYNSDTDLNIIAPGGPDEGGFLVGGGGSVGCRAFNLAFVQGYRSISMYGMDCSFASDGTQHAGIHYGKTQNEWINGIRVGDRVFRTSPTLIYTARGFILNYRSRREECERNNEPCFPGTNHRFEVRFHGDGLLQEMAYIHASSKAAA